MSGSPVKHGRIFVSSGHLIDAPGRAKPRFPAYKEKKIGEAIDQQLLKWKPMPGDLAICGAARGSDILFAESCTRYDVELWLFVAKPEKDFLKESVCLPNSNWEDRYYALRNHPNVSTFFQHQKEQSKEANPFADANDWIISTAEEKADSGDSLYALLVWDEKSSGDGPGGTADFAHKVKRSKGHLAIINPLKFD